MPEDPFYLKLLERLGFNTTKMRWRLYRIEQKAQQVARAGPIPASMQWVKYAHKTCTKCGALNDGAAKTCTRCERRLPSMLVNRIMRTIGVIVPANAPAVTYGFLGVTITLFLIQAAFGGIQSALKGDEATVLVLGALAPGHNVLGGDWWRMFAFGLSHFGIAHIVFNSMALTQLGPLAEDQLGRKRMLVLLTVSQLGAALATVYWYSGTVSMTAGASGVVCGLLGFGIELFYQMGERFNAYRRQLVQWAVFIVLFGLFMGANNAAHIGGGIAGMIPAWIIGSKRRHHPIEETLWEWAFWICAILWAAVLVNIGISMVGNMDVLLGAVE